MKNITIAFLAAVSLASFGGCKKHGGGTGDMLAKQVEFKDAMCKCTDKACAEKVSADMAKWGQDNMPKDQKEAPKLSEADTKAFTDNGMKMAECMQKAMGGGEAPAAGSADGSAAAGSADGSAAPAAAGGGDLPAECADYKAGIEKLATCEKLPQATRDALKGSYDQMSAAWGTAATTPETKAAMATGCKSAADALKQAAAVCN